MKKNDIKIVAIGILLLLTLAGSIAYVQIKQREVDLKAINKAISLEVTRNSDSSTTAKIDVIESDLSTFEDYYIDTGIESAQRLKKAVRKHRKRIKKPGSSVIVFDTKTKIDTSLIEKEEVDTFVIESGKLIPKHQIQKYYDVNLGGWVTGSFSVISFDSMPSQLEINIDIKNEYEAVVGYEKKGFFKKRKPFVEITNKNPYSETIMLRSYKVRMPKQKRFGVGPMVGLQFDLKGNLIPVYGIGASYHIIEF